MYLLILEVEMAKDDIPTVSTKLYGLLKPLTPEKRQWAIKAAYAMLGEAAPASETPKQREEQTPAGGGGDSKLPARVKSWMKTHGVADNMLSNVFHVEDGKAEITASHAQGKNAKEQTINTYILTGIAKLLETGEAKFDDETARTNCKALGCFNTANHAAYMKKKSNVLGGSKAGWTLTGPGMKTGAELVKQYSAVE